MLETDQAEWGDVSVDALEQLLLAEEAVIARRRARQLRLLRALDRAQVAAVDGCRTLAEWVAGRLDVTPETAASLVRASRSLDEQPGVAGELERGDVTFDRAAETLRLTEAGAPPDIIEASRGYDLAGVRRLTGRHRRLTPTGEHTRFADRYLAVQPSLDHSGWRLWGRLPAVDGAVVERALTERADTFPTPPTGIREPLGARRADALVTLAHDALHPDSAGQASPGGENSGSGGPLVTVFVDATVAAPTRGEAGVAVAAGPRVGPAVLEELLCTGTIEVTATAGGQPLAVGRASRVVSPRLRRAVLHRDGGCVADGCRSRYRLQTHHRLPYSQGGRTDPNNLLTLCWYHHHVVVHGRGYHIAPDSPPQRIRFAPPTTGRSPPHPGTQPLAA